jgi:predicted HTH domain antitoxin
MADEVSLMAVVIPDETVRATKLTDDELRREIAVMLFAQEKLTLGRAAELAGMLQIEFQRLLGERQIPMHYGVEDYRRDMETLRRMKA